VKDDAAHRTCAELDKRRAREYDLPAVAGGSVAMTTIAERVTMTKVALRALDNGRQSAEQTP
jgi:hypothetical protein